MLKLFPFLFLQVVVALLLLLFVRMLLLLLQVVLQRLNLSPSGVNPPLKICPALFALLVVLLLLVRLVVVVVVVLMVVVLLVLVVVLLLLLLLLLLPLSLDFLLSSGTVHLLLPPLPIMLSGVNPPLEILLLPLFLLLQLVVLGV
jgi:hypothetical protein